MRQTTLDEQTTELLKLGFEFPKKKVLIIGIKQE